jgi:hypothetical protein
MRLRSHARRLKLVSAVGHETSRVDELTLPNACGEARHLAKRDGDDRVDSKLAVSCHAEGSLIV